MSLIIGFIFKALSIVNKRLPVLKTRLLLLFIQITSLRIGISKNNMKGNKPKTTKSVQQLHYCEVSPFPHYYCSQY